MKIAIMQPYLFPYIGYFQLMNAVDEFVLYDNIEFTKKGWINRNRILMNGKDILLTFPLKKDSDFRHVRERFLSDTWSQERIKSLNRISELYKRAPVFDSVFPLLKTIFLFEETNLFKFILHSLQQLNKYLQIQTPVIISSSIDIDHSLRSENKVIAICKARKADEYINPIGGTGLYNQGTFKANGIQLHFLKTGNVSYEQFGNDFIPYLSIIDVMMFNTVEEIKDFLNNKYTLVDQ